MRGPIRRILNFLKRLLRSLKLMMKASADVIAFKIFKRPTKLTTQDFVDLFCGTRGYSHSFLEFLLNLGSAKKRFLLKNSILKTNLDDIGNLKSEGYLNFDFKLSSNDLEEFMKFTSKCPASLRITDEELLEGNFLPKRAIFDPLAVKAARYEYSAVDLLESRIVQKLIADPYLLSLAQEYLGQEPVLDIVSLWWHTDFKRVADAEAAQLFHFDLDTIKWIKFFFYITSVGPKNGPHMFVKGTHKAGAIPAHLLRQGYVRHSDLEIEEAFGVNRIIQFLGPAGSGFAEDTKGLHKGLCIEEGNRLVFQIQFNASAFMRSGQRLVLPKNIDPKLEEAIKLHPKIYGFCEKTI